MTTNPEENPMTDTATQTTDTEPDWTKAGAPPAPEPQAEQERHDEAASMALAHYDDVVANLPQIPGKDEFLALCQMARVMSTSGIVPKSLQGKPADCLIVLLTGRDLGIPVTAATRKVYVIDGQPSIAPLLKLGLIRRDGLGKIVPDPQNRTNERLAVAHALDRFGNELGPPMEFSWDDAVAATLVRSDCEPSKHSDKCLENRKKEGTRQSNGATANYCKDNWRKNPRRMLWWRAASFAADDYFPEVSMGIYCLSTRAEALTRAGWRTHDKITPGDEILSYDVEAGVCRWVPVRRVRTYEAAQTYRIEHSRWAAVATGTHRWVIQRKGWPSNRDPGREIRTTETIRRGGGSLVLAAPTVDEEMSTLDEREAAIVGWLLTDGSFRWREDLGRGGTVAASIQQSKRLEAVRSLFREGEMTERIATVAGTQNIRGKEYECREHHVFQLRSAFAKTLLTKAGMRTKADAVQAVTRLSSGARRSMLDAMIQANGSDASEGPTGQKHVVFFTGHREVLDAFQALCALTGQALGRERRARGCWAVTLRRSRGVEAASLSVTEHDVEPVWCPTTDLGTWVARLDGYVFITGNSPDELGGMTDDDGNLIEANSVELPAGFGTGQGGTGGNRQGGAAEEDAPVSPEVSWSLQQRIYSLPADAQEEFRKRWKQAKVPGNVRHFPAAKAQLVEAFLRGVESQWKAQGGFDPDAALATTIGRLGEAVVATLQVWPAGTPAPNAAPPTDSVPGADAATSPASGAGVAQAALLPAEVPTTAEPAQAATGTTTAPLAGDFDPDAWMDRVTSAERGEATVDDVIDYATGEVKKLKLPEVNAALVAAAASTDGAADDRRARLAALVCTALGVPVADQS